MTAWAVVIVAALGSRVVIPVSRHVAALAASVSLGLCVGGVVGAVLARGPAEPTNVAVLVESLDAHLPCLRPAWLVALRLADDAAARCCLLAATVAAIGAAVLSMMILVGLVFLVDRSRRCAGICPPPQRGCGSIMRIAQVLTASTGGIGRPSRGGHSPGPARPCRADLCTR